MVAKFEVGKIYLASGQFAYLVLKRKGKLVWFWDLTNVNLVFRRTARIYEWSHYEVANANVLTVNGSIDYNYVIEADIPENSERWYKKLNWIISGLKKELLNEVAQQVNKFGPYIVNGKVNRKMLK